jgi:Mrp family chromosome partitioning ATPase
MGRMLEAFKRIEPRRPQLDEGPVGTPPDWPQPETGAQARLAVEEVPYIEVGGPRSTIDASPQVLAAGGKRASQPKSDVQGPRLRAVIPPTLADAPTRIMSVIFRPMPEGPSALGPPEARFGPELVALHHAEHPVSQQYRTVAEGIAGQLPAGRSQVILFTALMPESGTTTVLLNTAITFAGQRKLRVVVVEANLERPALAKRLGLPEMPGLREFLSGSRTLTDALQETGQPNLLALTQGTGDAPGSLSDALRPVVRHLRERFDLVLMDAPCWDGSPEVVALGSLCDLVYVVLPEAESATPATESWIRTLPQEGARLRGCIVTQR